MKNPRTDDKLLQAKRLLMDALKAAQDEKLPQSLARQIDTLIGKTEHLQNNIMSR